MRNYYFMGIDNGGSATKCVIFNQKGAAVASASTHIPRQQPREGHTERDGNEVWAANCRVIREALHKSGLPPEDICAVSMCGYGGGIAFLDADGNSVSPFVISTDSRAAALLEQFQGDGTDDALYPYTYQRLWAGQPGMLLPWFSRYEPDILKDTSSVMMIKDFIRFRLTGVIGTEKTDASNTNLFNIHTGQFDKEIFRLLGIEHCFSFFPEKLYQPWEISGTVTPEAAKQTGLRAGTPVAAGLYDVASCSLASSLFDASTLALVVGTWSISGHLTPHLEECMGRSNTLAAFLEGWYFSEESSPTSASNLDWFIEHYYRKSLPKDINVYEYCNNVVAHLNPADSDLIFIPYLYGSNFLPTAKGAFFNLSGYHTEEHVLLAIYEGILFSLLQHVEALYGSRLPASARFSGGASRSSVWCQMLADILGFPVDVMDCEELGAMGAAICAAIAGGVYKDYQEAAAHMCRIRQTYEPDSERHALYRQKYRNYQKAVRSLGFFHSQPDG